MSGSFKVTINGIEYYVEDVLNYHFYLKGKGMTPYYNSTYDWFIFYYENLKQSYDEQNREN